jgi:beta-glucosidase-like glycosyl hydrolase
MQAQLSERRTVRAARGSGGPSPVLVIGIVLLAASLVAIGTAIVLTSMGLRQPLVASTDAPPATRPPAAAPTPPATPGVFTVGRQGEPTPTTAAQGTPATTAQQQQPSLFPPPGPSGGPLVNPQPPVVQQPGPGSAPPSASTTTNVPPAVTEGAPVAGSASPGTGPAAAAPSDPAVDEALAKLSSVEDKVGQLLLLAWIGSRAEDARPTLRELRAGGIVFVQNTTQSAEATVINQGLRQIAGESGLLPPLIAIDHEGGIVQRIKDVENRGNNVAFAQRAPSDLEACQRGQAHAQTLKAMGFTVNLAPVLDVNNNPNNPVIGPRSYSDNPEVVARLGAAYIKGLQGGGIAAIGKHFPGHGNTSVDSHLGLPSLPQTVEQLEQIELVPFRRAIEADIAGIMSAHIVFPAVDSSGAPATLSREVMTGLLRDRLGFRGLAVTDDMGAMRAITDNFGAGEAAVRAVNAGVDLLILSAEFPRQQQARDALVAAVRDGIIPRERLEKAVRNVLQVKARFGMLGNQPALTGGGCA